LSSGDSVQRQVNLFALKTLLISHPIACLMGLITIVTLWCTVKTCAQPWGGTTYYLQHNCWAM